jgi:hypothetical protein
MKKGTTCHFCNKPFGTDLPFTCKYCGEKYCTKHRLPEHHKCLGLAKIKERIAQGESPWFPEKKV